MVGTTGFYAITCPDCDGRMFIDRMTTNNAPTLSLLSPDARGRTYIEHVICPTCQGDGRLLIPENTTVFRLKAKHAIAITISAALLILVVIGIVVTR